MPVRSVERTHGDALPSPFPPKAAFQGRRTAAALPSIASRPSRSPHRDGLRINTETNIVRVMMFAGTPHPVPLPAAVVRTMAVGTLRPVIEG
jgi:hypothetical protein